MQKIQAHKVIWHRRNVFSKEEGEVTHKLRGINKTITLKIALKSPGGEYTKIIFVTALAFLWGYIESQHQGWKTYHPPWHPKKM